MSANEHGAGETTVVTDGEPIGLKRRSVILMIVLTIATFGLYHPTWFLRRRAALNRLDSPRKLSRWPFLIYLAFLVFQLGIGLAFGPARARIIAPEASLLISLVRLALLILMVVQSFFVKDILEDHLAGPQDSLSDSLLSGRVKLSGLMTFFFQIYYLQYVINRDIVGQPAMGA